MMPLSQHKVSFIITYFMNTCKTKNRGKHEQILHLVQGRRKITKLVPVTKKRASLQHKVSLATLHTTNKQEPFKYIQLSKRAYTGQQTFNIFAAQQLFIDRQINTSSMEPPKIRAIACSMGTRI
jgi:hypothetical protein